MTRLFLDIKPYNLEWWEKILLLFIPEDTILTQDGQVTGRLYKGRFYVTALNGRKI